MINQATIDAAKALFPNMPIPQLTARIYACRCHAHRYRSFGFEVGLNHLDAPALRLIALFLPTKAATACLAEADKKEAV